MKTIKELHQVLIDFVESKTGKPFPTEPIFVETAKEGAKRFFNTYLDGRAYQDVYSSKLDIMLWEEWINLIEPLLQQSLESNDRVQLDYNNISLTRLRPRAEQLLSQVSQLAIECSK